MHLRTTNFLQYNVIFIFRSSQIPSRDVSNSISEQSELPLPLTILLYSFPHRFPCQHYILSTPASQEATRDHRHNGEQPGIRS